jgi:hypothetical protein
MTLPAPDSRRCPASGRVAVTALAALALLLGGGAPAATAAVQEPVCATHDDGATTCVTSIAVAPPPVESATGGTATITVTLSGTRTDFEYVTIGYELATGTLWARLPAVPGDPNTYRGGLEVPAGAPVGSFPALTVGGGVSGGTPDTSWNVYRPELVAGGIPGTLTIAGTPDAEGPVLRSLSVSATQFDTTMGPATVTIEARVTDGHAGATRVTVGARYQRAPGADPASYPSFSGLTGLTLVSGTAADGIWRGELEVSGGTRGTWPLNVHLTDRWDNERDVGSDELAAAGLPSVLRSDTTTPPARPTLTGRTWIHTECCYPVVVDGVVNWARPSGTPAVSGVVLESYSPACGTPPNWRPIYPWDREIVFDNRTLLAPCTVTMRMVNAAGASPPGSVTFW